ncbi:MAG: radical SAM protein [Planctomycetes bacterium]|nr:radical SAM protein [Planctomycetota bacterium]
MASDAKDNPIHLHRRQWRNCRCVYPVISRRAGGLSIGVNLNLDKRCNFSCVYCQVDRRKGRKAGNPDLELLGRELHLAMEEAISGRLWDEPGFRETPVALRRINDIAFSGDGEPTCLADFDKAVKTAARVKAVFSRPDVKLVVITNSTLLESPQVRRALPIMDESNGEIWAKLDAGTQEYFEIIDRPAGRMKLDKIIAGIKSLARRAGEGSGKPGCALVIQTLFMKLDGQGPDEAQIGAYCGRLNGIISSGGRIELVQLHTIARPPATESASAMADSELDRIAAKVRAAVPGVPVGVYYGRAAGADKAGTPGRRGQK